MELTDLSHAKRLYFSWGQICLCAVTPPLYFLCRPVHDVLAAAVVITFPFHAAGMFLPGSRLLGDVFARGDGRAWSVALTFDDGPEPRTTPAVLDSLAREGARATFFVVGERARAHPEIVRRMAAEGHQIGNHTWSHRLFFASYLTPRRTVRREIEEGARAIEEITGSSPRFLRPPMGFKNVVVMGLAERLGLVLTTFSVRSGDTRRGATAVRIARRAASSARPGSIILFHDGTDDPARRERLLAALTDAIAELRERGFRFVTVEDLHDEAGPTREGFPS